MEVVPSSFRMARMPWTKPLVSATWARTLLAMTRSARLPSAASLSASSLVKNSFSVGTPIFGVGLFGYGIWPGQNDYVKDVGMVVSGGAEVLALKSFTSVGLGALRFTIGATGFLTPALRTGAFDDHLPTGFKGKDILHYRHIAMMIDVYALGDFPSNFF